MALPAHDLSSQTLDDLAVLRQAAARARPVALAREQVLPVLDELTEVIAGPGLRRGSVVLIGGTRGVGSMTLALAAGPSRAGSWVATVGFEGLGLVAARQLGVSLDRFVAVDRPPAAAWGAVVAALTDAFDVVVLDLRSGVPTGAARRLAARTRDRGAVLLLVGEARAWPTGADVEITVTGAGWQGLGEGYGYLRARRMVVEAGGRRGAVRPRRVELWLPSVDGMLAAVEQPAVALAPETTGTLAG